MIPINDIYLGANDLANAHQTGAKISPEEFNRVVPDMLNSFVRKMYGLEDEYSPGMPQPKMGYEITQLITDNLSEILMNIQLQIDAKGKAIKPSDYLHHSKLTFVYLKNIGKMEVEANECHVCCDECSDPCEEATKPLTYQQATQDQHEPMYRDVCVVKESKFTTYMGSANRKPTKDFPIAVYRGNIIQFAPFDLKEVNYSYLRMPKRPVFTYDIDVDGNVVYSPTGALPLGNTGVVNVELPLVCSYQLCALVAKRFGFYSRDVPLVQLATSVEKTGL